VHSRVGGAFLGIAVAVAAVAGLPAYQGVRRSTNDGVFTAAQVERGKSLYDQHCQQCHGVALGGGVGRRLAGDAFIADWGGIGLDRLLGRISSMPPGGPRLDESDQVALLSYILDFNGFPKGEVPLTAEIARAVSIADHGSDAAPESGLIQAVGCLTRSPERQWMLTDAAAPVRTKDPSASSESARELLAQTSPGTRAYRLLNAYPAPDRFEGQRVEVKGLLIRGAADSLNVTAIAGLAAECRR
jgi:mono/diheme cytochrome c family protein